MSKKKNSGGRPEHKPTEATRKHVAVAAGGGMAHEEIALGLGISRNTLEKHYGHELSLGAAGKRLEVVQSLFKAAKSGKVAAIKEYLASTPQVAPPPVAKDKPVGKKVQAQADAAGAARGSEWQDDLPRHGDTKH